MKDKIYIIIFILIIFLPLGKSFLSQPNDISLIEKRKLATIPKLPRNIPQSSLYPSKLNNYFDDRYGFRLELNTIYKSLKSALGDSPSKDVTIGKNGWLFLGSNDPKYAKFNNPFGVATALDTYQVKDLNKVTTYMKAVKQWLEAKEIKHLFFIAPIKQTIYIEKLKYKLPAFKSENATDQLYKYLRSHTTIDSIDFRPDLLAQSKQKQLYYKIDTHWNHHATNIVQNKLVKHLIELFDLNLLPKIFKINEKTAVGPGDLINLIGIAKSPYLHTNIENENLEKNSEIRILIFGDSFAEQLLPFLELQFEHVLLVRSKLDSPALKKRVLEFKPDIVIEEWVERDLPQYVPGENPNAYDLD